MAQRLAELVKSPVCVLGNWSSPVELGLAALSRRRLELASPAWSALGFIDHRKAGLDPAACFDFNFDLAFTLFCPPALRQDADGAPSRAEMEARFLTGGAIPLIISTKSDASELGRVGNVGDNFGLHVVRHLTSHPVQPHGLWIDREAPAMLTIGSYIQHARNRGLVWGTGSVTATPWKPRVARTNSVFLGVRGPRTREHLLRHFALAPPVIGDPGLLIRDILADVRSPVDQEVGFIVHGLDRDFFMDRWPDGFFIRNRQTPDIFVQDATRCRAIVTTSLHGLIFSHALGIPAVAIKVGDRIPGGEHKFIDYHQSIGDYGFRGRAEFSDGRPMDISAWARLVAETPQPTAIDLAPLYGTFPFPR